MSVLDPWVLGFDRALRTLFVPATTVRPSPSALCDEVELSGHDRQSAAALMRVNHVGEVCAQALYQGQALACRDEKIKASLQRASDEEVEHLAWTEQRIAELGGRKSVLNPLWYAGSLALGVLAGKAGDRWSLGFLAETERQVEAHLDSHLGMLPEGDAKSRAIVAQMKADEVAHAEMAVHLGAADLPLPVKGAMRVAARVMTRTAYYV